jgi:hypothetical protein
MSDNEKNSAVTSAQGTSAIYYKDATELAGLIRIKQCLPAGLFGQGIVLKGGKRAFHDRCATERSRYGGNDRGTFTNPSFRVYQHLYRIKTSKLRGSRTW